MVKHIVMFKLKESLSENEKVEIMNNFKSAIESLPEKIKFIKDIHVGLNINPSEKWDICLDSTFDSLRFAGRCKSIFCSSRSRGCGWNY